MIGESFHNLSSFNYLPLLIGWLMGLLSTLILTIINRYAKAQEVKKGIEIEIKQLQIRLAGICIITTMGNKKVDQKWIKWIRPYLTSLTNSEEFNIELESRLEGMALF